MIDTRTIDRIYEAAVVQEKWAPLLQDLADHVGSAGSILTTRCRDHVRMIASPKVADAAAQFVAEGWGINPDQSAPFFAELYPGFRAEIDYRTAEEIARLPVHAEFLDPRGYIAGAGTIIQGSLDDGLHLSFDGFASHEAALAALPFLNSLRSHLARALSLTSQLGEANDAYMVDTLKMVGIVAAIVGGNGRLRAANDRFFERLGGRLRDGRDGIRFTDRFLNAQYHAALAAHYASGGQVQSIPVLGDEGEPPFAVHLLPIRGAARDRCDSDGVLMVIADGANATIPDADLLRVMFDLTPAQAGLTRKLLEGKTLAEAAQANTITQATARVHLRAVFAKTGVSRQAELVRLLAGLGPPLG